MFIKRSVLKLFIVKYNNATHRNLFKFFIPYHVDILFFIKKFLIPRRIVLHLTIEKSFIFLFLPKDQPFRYFISMPNNRKTFFSCSSTYLAHVNKSSLPVVRDFYILQTKKGLLSFEEALLLKESGTLFLSIFFFDKRQLQIFK